MPDTQSLDESPYKGIDLGPWIKEVPHYEADDKSPMVKYLCCANSVSLSFEHLRNNLGTNGII